MQQNKMTFRDMCRQERRSSWDDLQLNIVLKYQVFVFFLVFLL